MWLDWVSNPESLALESDTLQNAVNGPAIKLEKKASAYGKRKWNVFNPF